jgi:hypothetical protein
MHDAMMLLLHRQLNTLRSLVTPQMPCYVSYLVLVVVV